MSAKKKAVQKDPSPVPPLATSQAIPTGATKTDFYDAIKELLVVAKDIQRMIKDFHADSFVSKD